MCMGAKANVDVNARAYASANANIMLALTLAQMLASMLACMVASTLGASTTLPTNYLSRPSRPREFSILAHSLIFAHVPSIERNTRARTWAHTYMHNVCLVASSAGAVAPAQSRQRLCQAGARALLERCARCLNHKTPRRHLFVPELLHSGLACAI
jgi:hypothetical protein